jgi:hypothetical protein
MNFLSSLFIKKIKQKWLNGKRLCNGVPGGCFQVFLQTSPWATIQMCRWQFRKPPGVPLNLTRGPSPKLTVPAAEERAEGLTGGETAPVRWPRVQWRSWGSRRCAGRRRGWSELAGPCAQAGELIGCEESGLSRAQLTNQMGQRASPGIKEGVCVRNWTTAHRIARSTCTGGRPKSGEDDLGSPVKLCRVREPGKLHKLLAKLTERLARLGSDQSGLATVVEARVAMAGGRELTEAKEGRMADEGEHGVRWGAPGEAL